DELAINTANSSSPHFLVEVYGASRELHPIVRDEVYRVASEALRNAFLHAHARQIEVEIRYEDGELLATIRDDGKGIDPQVLAGKAGHFGLPGMHERAKLVGGRLEVRSERNQGTEIQLSIPAGNAYTELARGGWRRRSLSRKRKDKEINIGS
ncbi:MAG TPA: ATP-binding protein, partial [Terriglobales bacterium]|nr:ATP-binding protein [Terriglobales bacterium]